MLILSRKLNEEIVIADNIIIKIASIDNDKVKIGVVAPKSVKVYRRELLEDIRSVNIESAKTSADLLEKLAGELTEEE